MGALPGSSTHYGLIQKKKQRSRNDANKKSLSQNTAKIDSQLAIDF
jgi:hypothetical protein